MVVELGLLVLSVALAYAAGELLKKKQNVEQPEKPTTLTQRGSYVPLLKGIRRVGPMFCWAGERFSTKVAIPGSGGITGKKQKQTIWWESAWHALCVGPAQQLTRIWANDTVIFDGPINRQSHPSGTVWGLPNALGQFQIFWGENGVSAGQPINTYLADSNRVGVASSWPQLCYIVWRPFQLGPQPTWPRIEYEISTRPVSTLLSMSNAVIGGSYTLSGTIRNINAVVNGIPGTGYIQLLGDQRDTNLHGFRPGDRIRVTNNAAPDQDLTLGLVDVLQVVTDPGDPPNGIPPTYALVTRMYLTTTISGFDATGEVEAYAYSFDEGLNAAHIVADLLFEPAPHGLALDQDEYDIDSLEDLGVLIEAEDLRSSVIASGGSTAQGMLGSIMQDIGFLIPRDTETGKFKFVPVREPSGTLRHIDDDLLVSYLPQISQRHGPRKADRFIYAFTDRSQEYQDSTIGHGDDGQSILLEHLARQSINVPTTVHGPTVARIGDRRAMEELAGGILVALECNRGARRLLPGEAVTCDEIPAVLRVLEVKPTPNSNLVKVDLQVDFYGAEATGYLPTPPPPAPTPTPTQPDLALQIFELPELLTRERVLTIMALRIRANASIITAVQHITRDFSTYVQQGADDSVMTGGDLTSALAADGLEYLAQGPTIDILGEDVAEALDLSGDLTSWAAGRQIAVVGDEVMFVQKLTALGGDSYRLDGVMRARYGTAKAAHSVGADVFILSIADDGLLIQDVLLEPEVLIGLKSQPYGDTGLISLTSLLPVSKVLYGAGPRPMPVATIRLDQPGPQAHYAAGGGDLDIVWGYFVPGAAGTGAGMMGAGVPTSDAPPDSTFTVEILNSSNVVVRTFTSLTAGFTYTGAQRSTDFSGDPAEFRLRITSVRGGLVSSSVTQAFLRL